MKFNRKEILEKFMVILNEKIIGAIELKPKRKFYDYEANIIQLNTEHIIPVEIKNR